jgi:hypothetical protein
VLSSTSASGAAADTLCIADSELLSFETATLASTYNYNLTTLYRGLYGTMAAAHSSGAPFARLDGAAFKYGLPAQYVGQKLYIKLQCFNVFGGGVEELSTCAVYTYTPTGAALDHPVAQQMLSTGGSPLDFGSVTTSPGVEDDFGSPFTLAVEFDVDLGPA